MTAFYAKQGGYPHHLPGNQVVKVHICGGARRNSWLDYIAIMI